jgi:hypothetical protein
MNPMGLAQLYQMMVPQQPPGFEDIAGLFGPPPAMNLPQPPTPVSGFGGLPGDVQGQGNREAILTLAQLLGSAPSGQIGTAIASAAGAVDPIRRGYVDDYNERQMGGYEQERAGAMEGYALEAQQHEAAQRSQMTQQLLQMAGEMSRQDPSSAGAIRTALLSAGGDPAVAFESLSSLRQQQAARSEEEARQRQMSEALAASGISPQMGAFPGEAGDLMAEAEMRRLQMGDYAPEPPDPGSWTSAGNGYIFNTRGGPGSASQIFEPPGNTPSPSYTPDWYTGQVFDRRTGEFSDPPPGFERRPKDAGMAGFLRIAEDGGGKADFSGVRSSTSPSAGPGPKAPPLGPTPVPEPEAPGRARPSGGDPQTYVDQGLAYLKTVDPVRAARIEEAVRAMPPAQAAAEMKELLESL